MPEHAIPSSLATKRELFLKLKKQKELKNNERITPRERKGRIPVSCIQEATLMPVINGFYDPEKNRASGPALGYLIKGRVNLSAFHRTIQEIVKRHEILRTRYDVVEKQPYQVINEVPDNILKVVDLNNLSEDERKDELNRIALNRASESFSFFKDPLMISFTIITAKDEHALYFFTNHIATDGVSMGRLQFELLALYQSYSLNIPIPLPELSLQYADFAIWERERFSGEYLEEKLAYWKHFTGKINSFLPVDHRPDKFSYGGGIVPVVLLPQMTRELKKISMENGVTLFTILYAAFIELIHIFSGYKYNYFTFVVANRTQKETEPLIGCFMDWQFHHIELDRDLTFLEVVDRTNKTLLKVYDNYVPAYHVRKTIPPQDPVVNFQLQSFGGGSAKSSETASEKQETQPKPETETNDAMSQNMPQPMMFIPLKVEQPTFALFPIETVLRETGETINGTFTYKESFYDRSTIVNLTNDYVLLLNQIIKNPEIRMSEMKMKPHKSVIEKTIYPR